MKTILLFLIALLACSYLQANQYTQPVGSDNIQLSRQELLRMKPREIAKKTSVKLNFFERMIIRKIQKRTAKGASKTGKTSAVLSLLLGVFSLIAFPIGWANGGVLLFLGPLAGIIGTVFGIISLGRKNGEQRGAAIVGLILSALWGPLVLFTYGFLDMIFN